MATVQRFDHFMENALYGPRGYYTGDRQIFGARGDFTTSPKLSLAFGRALSHWILDAWKHHQKRLPVIEVGPGDGSLALNIRQSFPLWLTPFLSYHLVEKSPRLRERQQERLGRKARWHDSLSDALAYLGGEALILSNELIDAFPVRIFRKNEPGTWDELHLDGTREIWHPAAELPASCQFDHPWPAGQRLEIHESAHHFLRHELAPMTRGDLLTIDYGLHTPAELYHRRPRGNFRAFLHHHLLDPPAAYQNPGRQDLTTDVCFADLENWLADLGFRTLSLRTQEELLTPHLQNTLADIYLSHPAGPGTAFLALHSRKA
ncbi:MAG: SAM-dependent methyltransferase [Verrucomicrobiales bacterium]